MSDRKDIDEKALKQQLIDRKVELERLVTAHHDDTRPVVLDQTTVGRLSRETANGRLIQDNWAGVVVMCRDQPLQLYLTVDQLLLQRFLVYVFAVAHRSNKKRLAAHSSLHL